MKIRPVGSKSSIQTNEGTDRQTRRQTDMTKLVVTLHSFANSPKIADFTRFAVAPPFGGGGGGGRSLYTLAWCEKCEANSVELM